MSLEKLKALCLSCDRETIDFLNGIHSLEVLSADILRAQDLCGEYDDVELLVVGLSYLLPLGSRARKEFFSSLPFATVVVATDTIDAEIIAECLANGVHDFIDTSEKISSEVRLSVRVGELARKKSRAQYHVGSIEVDVAKRRIQANDKSCFLSPTEMNLLHCLAMGRGNIIQRQTLKRVCWGGDVSDNALNRKLHEVRKSLKSIDEKVEIRTIYGTGFRLDTGEPSSSIPEI